MDEKSIVISRDEFDIKCHADGLVEISAGDGHLLQISCIEFEQLVDDRMRLMHNHNNFV